MKHNNDEESSLDTTKDIYIDARGRAMLFQEITACLKDGLTLNEVVQAEVLEKYCLGKTYLPDYAYSRMKRLIKKEYRELVGE